MIDSFHDNPGWVHPLYLGDLDRQKGSHKWSKKCHETTPHDAKPPKTRDAWRETEREKEREVKGDSDDF